MKKREINVDDLMKWCAKNKKEISKETLLEYCEEKEDFLYDFKDFVNSALKFVLSYTNHKDIYKEIFKRIDLNVKEERDFLKEIADSFYKIYGNDLLDFLKMICEVDIRICEIKETYKND